MSKKEIAVTVGAQGVQGIQGPQGLVAYGPIDDTPVDMSDLLIPKILLMQGMSKLVGAEKALSGDMIDSISNAKLGNKESSIEVIPFHVTKTWVIFEEINGKLEYKEIVPFNETNATWKWDDVDQGVKIRRDKSINYYVLLPSEINAGMYMPYVVSFRRTSYQGGQKLETARAKFQLFKKPIFAKTFKLLAIKESNDKGTFNRFDVETCRDTTPEEIAAVNKWRELVKAPHARVDDSDLKEFSGITVHVTEEELPF